MLSCQRNSPKVHETYYQIFQHPTVVDMLESISINVILFQNLSLVLFLVETNSSFPKS